MGLHTFLRHYHINKHSVGVGTELSRPTIIKEEHIQIPQNL